MFMECSYVFFNTCHLPRSLSDICSIYILYIFYMTHHFVLLLPVRWFYCRQEHRRKLTGARSIVIILFPTWLESALALFVCYHNHVVNMFFFSIGRYSLFSSKLKLQRTSSIFLSVPSTCLTCSSQQENLVNVLAAISPACPFLTCCIRLLL